MDWLLAPIDPGRVHEVGFAISWHGRTMVLAWGGMVPLAILMARYFKVLPRQDWPRVLDNQVWWRSHWMGNGVVLLLTVFGVGVILAQAQGGSWHGLLGYTLVILAFGQILLGIFRGSKGGPTALAADGTRRGDHYDMTPKRVLFEWSHKLLGYILLLLGGVTIVLGLWQANAPNWMWLGLFGWWTMLVVAAIILQRRGRAIDTYQAIWGPSPEHPGNRRKPIGWGIRRHPDRQPGD